MPTSRLPRRFLLLTGLLLAAAACPPGLAQDRPSRLDAYATLASDYVHRGLSQTAGDAALQAGLDYAHSSGFFAGGWLSNVEFEADYASPRPRDVEVDLYLGYARDYGRWSWAVTASEYLYPDATYDYDYTELTATAAYRRWVRYTASYSDDWIAGESTWNHELTGSVPLPWDLELAGTVGRIESGGNAPDYSHWNAGVTKLWRRYSADLRYYDTSYSRATYIGEPADGEWVLSLSIGLMP